MKKYLTVKIEALFGIYNGKIVFEEIVYKEDPEKFLNNDDKDLENLRNSTKNKAI